MRVPVPAAGGRRSTAIVASASRAVAKAWRMDEKEAEEAEGPWTRAPPEQKADADPVVRALPDKPEGPPQVVEVALSEYGSEVTSTTARRRRTKQSPRRDGSDVERLGRRRIRALHVPALMCLCLRGVPPPRRAAHTQGRS